MGLLCHSRRVRNNQKPEGLRAEALFPMSERSIAARACVITRADKVVGLNLVHDLCL